jgi:hypothetical protein
MTDAERAAVDTAAAEFFTNKNGSLHHQRADEELAIREAHHARLSAAGHRGGLIAGKGRPKPNLGQAQARSQSQSHSQESKPIASSDKSLSADANGNFVAYIPLVNGTEWGVSPAFQAELEAAYPEVDVPLTFKQIRAWCIANPQKRKTERGVARFINRWCEKEQNHG